MDISSKGFALKPRDLRRFDKKRVVFFNGDIGIIEFPWISIKRKEGYDHSVVDVPNYAFNEIKRIENGKVMIAERRSHGSALLTTGKGVKPYGYKRF